MVQYGANAREYLRVEQRVELFASQKIVALLAMVTLDDLEAARLSVCKYVETFYNPLRLYQSLGDKSPNQYEAAYAQATAAQLIPRRCFKAVG